MMGESEKHVVPQPSLCRPWPKIETKAHPVEIATTIRKAQPSPCGARVQIRASHTQLPHRCTQTANTGKCDLFLFLLLGLVFAAALVVQRGLELAHLNLEVARGAPLHVLGVVCLRHRAQRRVYESMRGESTQGEPRLNRGAHAECSPLCQATGLNAPSRVERTLLSFKIQTEGLRSCETIMQCPHASTTSRTFVFLERVMSFPSKTSMPLIMSDTSLPSRLTLACPFNPPNRSG